MNRSVTRLSLVLAVLASCDEGALRRDRGGSVLDSGGMADASAAPDGRGSADSGGRLEDARGTTDAGGGKADAKGKVDVTGKWDGSSGPVTPPLAGSPFGLVHGCAPGGNQQNWWDQGGSPSSLKSHASSASCGTEIPLIWTSPNWNAPPSSITTAMTAYFSTNPTLPIWQFGWEENIKGHCCTSANLTTLASQFAAVVAARTAAKTPNIKIAYQMVFQMNNSYSGTSANITNSSIGDFAALLASPAAAMIDLLAVHPYAWNNYPTPELWEEQYLAVIKSEIAKSANPKMQIIYTEGGAPVCSSVKSGCTLDEFGATVRGQGQQENAEYLVKHHVLAFNSGVQMVLWYEGKQFSGCSTTSPLTSAESCFGMPPLTVAAHQELQACMSGKSRAPTYRSPQAGVRVYEFAGASGTCTIAWTHDGTTQAVAPTLPVLSVSLATLTSRTVTKVSSTTGAPLSSSGSLSLSPAPVFIYTN